MSPEKIKILIRGISAEMQQIRGAALEREGSTREMEYQYLHLTGDVAALLKKLSAEEPCARELSAKVMGHLAEYDKRKIAGKPRDLEGILDYDPLQKMNWLLIHNNPDFLLDLDRLGFYLFEDRFDPEQVQHLFSGIKYLHYTLVTKDALSYRDMLSSIRPSNGAGTLRSVAFSHSRWQHKIPRGQRDIYVEQLLTQEDSQILFLDSTACDLLQNLYPSLGSDHPYQIIKGNKWQLYLREITSRSEVTSLACPLFGIDDFTVMVPDSIARRLADDYMKWILEFAAVNSYKGIGVRIDNNQIGVFKEKAANPESAINGCRIRFSRVCNKSGDCIMQIHCPQAYHLPYMLGVDAIRDAAVEMGIQDFFLAISMKKRYTEQWFKVMEGKTQAEQAQVNYEGAKRIRDGLLRHADALQGLVGGGMVKHFRGYDGFFCHELFISPIKEHLVIAGITSLARDYMFQEGIKHNVMLKNSEESPDTQFPVIESADKAGELFQKLAEGKDCYIMKTYVIDGEGHVDEKVVRSF